MVFGLISYDANLSKYLIVFRISQQMHVIFVDLLFNCYNLIVTAHWAVKSQWQWLCRERLHFKHGTLHLGHTMSPSLTHSVRWHALSTFSSISDWPFVFFAKKKVTVFLDWLSFCTTSEDRESGNSHGDS